MSAGPVRGLWLRLRNGPEGMETEAAEEAARTLSAKLSAAGLALWNGVSGAFRSEVWEKAYHATFPSQRSVFQRLDANGDGAVSIEELMASTRERGSQLGDTIWRTVSSVLWPLADLRWAVFLWRACGGLLLVAVLLTMLPGVNTSAPRHLLRWPILAVVYVVIAGELAAYAILRLFIRIVEALVAVPKHRRLRRDMEDAPSYDRWMRLARELDKSQGRDLWRDRADRQQHNWSFICELLADLRAARQSADPAELFTTLQLCTRANVGGVMGEEQFSYTNSGEPKGIVTEFMNEIVAGLDTLNALVCPQRKAPKPGPPAPGASERRPSPLRTAHGLRRSDSNASDEGRGSISGLKAGALEEAERRMASSDPELRLRTAMKLVQRAKRAFGSTALCLSGGAAMGNYHFGIVKALFEEGCLPDIISGTSAGSVVGAFVCTRRDDELKRDFTRENLLAHLTCFKISWMECFRNLWREGSLFQQQAWLDNISWWTRGDTTFEEAFQRTGRVLCITLSVANRSSPAILVNHITAPNVVIGSAILASAAVPGFINPMRLRIKGEDGVVRVHDNAELYFDGSITQDIPMTALADTFNCKFFITSQCNPHVVPFFFSSKGTAGQPSRWSRSDIHESWRGGFLLSVLEAYLKVDMLSKMHFLQIIQAAPGVVATLMTQDFDGNVTIVPRVALADYFKLISDPSEADIDRYLCRGRVAAWRKMMLLQHHYKLARQLEDSYLELEEALANYDNKLSPKPPAPFHQPFSTTPGSERRKRMHFGPDSDGFAAHHASESFGVKSLETVVAEVEAEKGADWANGRTLSGANGFGLLRANTWRQSPDPSPREDENGALDKIEEREDGIVGVVARIMQSVSLE